MAEEEEDKSTSEVEEMENKRKNITKDNAEALANIIANCDDVSAFLQAIAVKSPRIIAYFILLCSDKHARVWFLQWPGNNLPSPTNAPQDHTGLKRVLSDVLTRIQNSKALHPIVTAQCEADRETKGWDCLPTMAKQVTLEARA